MQPLAPSYVSHLDFLRFVRRLHATIGPAVLNATFLHWKMARIRRRFHGTIGPAVLKSTFFVPPGCQNSIPGNIFIVAEVLAPCLPCVSLPAAPVHPCLFPSLLASARPPDSGPADRCAYTTISKIHQLGHKRAPTGPAVLAADTPPASLVAPTCCDPDIPGRRNTHH